MKIIERFHDVETGQITDIEREETKKEKEQREAAELAIIDAAKKEAERETARQALLDKLGISIEEVKLLLQ